MNTVNAINETTRPLLDLPVVGPLARRAETTAVDWVVLQFSYLFCYKSLIEDLRRSFDSLIIEEDHMSTRANTERDDGHIIKDNVQNWQHRVINIKKSVENLFERYEQRPTWMCCKDIPFLNFGLGKQAAEDAKTVTELINSGREFRVNEIANPLPFDNLPISDTAYRSFTSRQEAYGNLQKALVHEDRYSILGIYGMPGVGKTVLMEEACKEAMKTGIFQRVIRANVGASEVDVKKLQDQLAADLRCDFKLEDNEGRRASQLKSSIMKGGKTLVILDDVWEYISLDRTGIPIRDTEFKGKILMTSRSREVCLTNNCEDPIEITMLAEDEAWDMFESVVGASKIESLQDSALAERGCRKCGRLPLLINAVGKALKFMSISFWDDAITQLEDGRYKGIAGMKPEVYSGIRLSFEKLTEAGKACLLLCSVYPEDADINIKDLSNLATGSQLLGRRRNIAGVVDYLKSSSLLLQGKYGGNVKLHDAIRDVARNIAAEDPYAFLSIRCSLGLRDNIEYHGRKLLHLDLQVSNVSYPNDLVCPDLHTLWLQGGYKLQKLSSGFAEGLTNLSFMIQGINYPEQQLSINRLENLKMIIVQGFDLDEAFFSSVPQNIETLCIRYTDLPSPLGLPTLKKLRKLELTQRYGTKIKMVSKSISSLWRLEELIIPCGFTIWEDEDAASIYVELNKLTQLRNLTIKLPYSQYCLNGDIISNLQDFNISVGSRFQRDFSEKFIGLMVDHLESGWMELVKRAEVVYLERVKDLFSDSMHREALANVKKLIIDYCDGMDHLMRLPVNRRNQGLTYFSNLCLLYIYNCDGLRYLFSASVARCLLNIQELKVVGCNAIEEIVTDDQEEIIISFPSLKELLLQRLPSLKSFSTHNKVALPSLEKLDIMYLEDSPSFTQLNLYNQEDSHSFTQLKSLTVRGCHKMENVIPVTLVHEFNNLEHIYIEDCKSLKTVFQRSSIARDTENPEDTDGTCVMFTSLKSLRLLKLPNIKCFWSYDPETLRVNPNQPKVSFPNLKEFRVWGCEISGLTEEIRAGRDNDSHSKLIPLTLNNVEEIQFLGSQWQLQLQNLESLYLENCMWHGHSLFKTTTPILNRLTEILLTNCEFGPTLFTTSSFRSFQQLRYLYVDSCDLLEEVVVEDSGTDNERTISLPCLYELHLSKLPSLKSFSRSSTYAFNMPALKNLFLKRCPRMDIFTSLPMNTPLLQDINDEYDEYLHEEQISDHNRYLTATISEQV